MRELEVKELRNISGGWSLSVAFINAAVAAGKSIYNFGRVIGSTIRGLVNGTYTFY